MPANRSRRGRSPPTRPTGPIFCQWARQSGVDPTRLPVQLVVVAAWVATQAPPIGRSALRRRVAAIAWHHRSTWHSWPDELIKAVTQDRCSGHER